jgi:hypothetical protein
VPVFVLGSLVTDGCARDSGGERRATVLRGERDPEQQNQSASLQHGRSSYD